MNLIAVDVGNTRISCGLFRQGTLVETWHYPANQPGQAANALAVMADGLPVALCSVVPSSAKAIADHLRSCKKTVLEIRTNSQKIIRDVYEAMGADRLADAVAAWKLYGHGANVLALDLGTATTITAVSSDGRFRGGLITLGLGRTLSALHEQTAQLPTVHINEDEPHVQSLAFDTESAIAQGTLLAHLGLIESWLKLGRKTLGGGSVAVATGGWSSLLAGQSKLVDFVDPHLTLKGIYLIAEEEGVQADPA